MRWIGLDLGEKRVGVAVSDSTGKIAFPLVTLARKTLFPDLQKIIAQYSDIHGFVVGFPKTLRGEVGHQAEKVQKSVEEIKAVFAKEIVLWDERLSTRAVAAVGKKNIDVAAAQFI